MLTITLPPDLAAPLAAEAERRGTTAESLALEAVRAALPPAGPSGPRNLLEFLDGYIGTSPGAGEPFSQDCGRVFADGLVSGRPARP